MKTCIAVSILVLVLLILGCVRRSDNNLPAASPVPDRLQFLGSVGRGVHYIQLIRVDGKEYIVNQSGGIIEHKSN